MLTALVLAAALSGTDVSLQELKKTNPDEYKRKVDEIYRSARARRKSRVSTPAISRADALWLERLAKIKETNPAEYEWRMRMEARNKRVRLRIKVTRDAPLTVITRRVAQLNRPNGFQVSGLQPIEQGPNGQCVGRRQEIMDQAFRTLFPKEAEKARQEALKRRSGGQKRTTGADL